MSRRKYDIFISYRREGGAQYARTLQLMLEKKKYRVFLDYDELVDGRFSPKIMAAIEEAPVYIILLSKGALARCANEGDWVRREIELALAAGKHIIPVNPDNSFDGVPADLPPAIKDAIQSNQHSEVNFGQTLNATVDLLVKNRIRPHIRPGIPSMWYIIAAVALLAGVAAGLAGFHHMRQKSMLLNEIAYLKESVTFNGQPLSWADDISREQLIAVREILDSMKHIEGGYFTQGALTDADGHFSEYVEIEFETPAFEVCVRPFYIGKYEVTTGQWNAIMGDNRPGDPGLPVADVTFAQAKDFAERLADLTLLPFRLPSESEWEYAAKGGAAHEGFIFAGSDDPEEVAWFAANSRGSAHSDLRPTPTADDLFNMSGNLSEWCDSPFILFDPDVALGSDGAIVIRGGNFDSEPYEITVTHREPADPDTAIPTLGFRLAMDKNI